MRKKLGKYDRILPERRYIDKGTPVVNPVPSTSHVAEAFISVKFLHSMRRIYVNLTKFNYLCIKNNYTRKEQEEIVMADQNPCSYRQLVCQF